MGVSQAIDITAAQRKVILDSLRSYLPNTTVWVYGSRVKWTSRPQSDLDMVVFTTPEQKPQVSNLKEVFEESSLPFRVDLFIWDEVPEQFCKNIKAEHVVLQENMERTIPKGWEEFKLSDTIELIGGGTPKRNRPEYWNGKIPWLSVKDFNHAYRHVDSAEGHITELGLSKSSTKILSKGQLIISARGTVGALAQLSRPMAFNQSCYGINANPEYTINDFLYYLIRYSVANFKQITHGAVFDTITQESFDHIKVNLPPLPEQRAIAHILGSLDDKIELNRRMNETLEAMAQALFKSWFVDFDLVIDNALAAGNPIPEELKERVAIRESLGDTHKPLPKEIQKLFPDEFELTEELGWIPKGWEVESVEQAIEINPAVKLQKGTVAKFVDMKALPTSGFPVSEVIRKGFSGGAKFRNGDVLLARITPCLENGKTGIVDFLDGDEVGFGSTEFIILREQNGIPSSFIACLARTKRFREHCISSMVGSSGRQRVQNACFNNYYIVVPPISILSEFSKFTKPKFIKLSQHSEQSKKLSKIRDTLLPKLLSGELRIRETEKFMEIVG